MNKGWDRALNNNTRPHRNYFVGSNASLTYLISIVLQVARAECISATNETSAQRMKNSVGRLSVNFSQCRVPQNQERPCFVGKAVNMRTAGQEVGCVNNIAQRW